MPQKLKEFPGRLTEKVYMEKVDAFLKPYFDGQIWEFSDQEIDDLRVRLKMSRVRTRGTRNAQFSSMVQHAAGRAGFGIKLQITHNGVAIQSLVQIPSLKGKHEE